MINRRYKKCVKDNHLLIIVGFCAVHKVRVTPEFGCLNLSLTALLFKAHWKFFQRCLYIFKKSMTTETKPNKLWSSFHLDNTEHTSRRLPSSFYKKSQLALYQKETLAQVFCCEFCKIFKNNYFYRTPTVAAFKNLITWIP